MVKAVLASLAVAALVAVSVADNVYERAGHLNDQRERLGHFKEKPFIDLYKTYAAAFIFPEHKERAVDDYRNYRPAQVECVNFLKEFRINKFKLRDIDQLVVLDACLGYLYDNADRDKDEPHESIKQLEGTQELQELYQNTHINELEASNKNCVADLLLNVIMARHQFPKMVCNSHWIQVFLQFAECQGGIEESLYDPENPQADSYLKILYELVRARVQKCAEFEVGYIEEAVRKAYASSYFTRGVNSFARYLSSQREQQKGRMWPVPVVRLLRAVENTTGQINLREVHALVRGVATHDQKLEKVLLGNIAEYATKTIKPRANTKENNADPTGVNRYTNLIDGLCSFFRSSDRESFYDFATPIIRLVRLLSYEKLFGLSQKRFISMMLTEGKESAPMYMCVSSCNILTYTEGAIATPMLNTKQRYEVTFVPDTTGMVLWPDAGYY